MSLIRFCALFFHFRARTVLVQPNVVAIPMAESALVSPRTWLHDFLMLERIVAAKVVEILLNLTRHRVQRHHRRVVHILVDILIVCFSLQSLLKLQVLLLSAFIGCVQFRA